MKQNKKANFEELYKSLLLAFFFFNLSAPKSPADDGDNKISEEENYIQTNTEI